MAPPNKAPQYMQESITMAEVGSIVKVSGSSIATPLGPPSPGNTPTKMPSTSPTIISKSVFQVSRTANPCRSRLSASIVLGLVAEGRFERALWHDDVERNLEGDKHGDRESESRQDRLPQCDPPDHPHEAGHQQKARDIEPERLRAEHEQEGRHEDLHDSAQLGTRNESLGCP